MSMLVLLYPLNFVVSLINPRWGFTGLIAIILIRPPDRVPELLGFPGYEVLLIGLLIGMVVHADKLNKPDIPQDALIAWVLALSIVGLMIQASGEVVDETKQFFSSIILYIFATRLIKNKKELFSVLFWLSIVTAVLAIEAMRSYLTVSDSPFTDPFSGRMQGLGYYGNPNEFGKLMCTAIPFLGIALFAGKGLFVRLLALAGIVIMVSAVGLTQSRTCFVVLGIIAVTPLIVSAEDGLAKRVVFLGLISLAFIYAFSILPGPLQDRMQSILNFTTDESFLGRTRAWSQGFQMVTWYPLYGVGKGQWYSYHGLAPHNSFVQVMAELGVPGIIMFGLIVWKSWHQLVAYVRTAGVSSDRAMVALSKGIAASYLGYLFYIFLGNQAYSPWTFFYFGICAVFFHISRATIEETHDKSVEATIENDRMEAKHEPSNSPRLGA